VRPQSRTAVLADTTGSEEAYRGRRFAAGCLPLAGDGTGLLPTLVPPSGARGAVQ
jgi:hypothetical protein